MLYDVIEVYKGFEVCKMGGGYTVEYCGEELYFTTVQEARDFIDEVTE